MTTTSVETEQFTEADGEQKGAEFFSAIVRLTDVDVRDPSQNPDNTWTFSGYAAVFDQEAIVLDSKFLQIKYVIDPHFFDEVFRAQPFGQPSGVVHFNMNHDMNFAVAATDVAAGQPGSLLLKADPKGLFYLAKVSRDDPDAVKLAVKMRDGVIRQASMTFLCAADQTTETETEEGPDVILRRLMSCKQLFDVCATPQGVFSQTISQLQTFAAGLGYSALTESHTRHPAAAPSGGARPVSPALMVTGGGAARRQEIAEMRRSLASIRRS
jgi:HK97 family phage prohead protease